MNEIFEKTECQVQVNEFIDKHLPAEERYITLGKFIRMFAEGGRKLKTPKKYAFKFPLSKEDKVKHLFSIQTSAFEAPEDLKGISNSNGQNVLFVLSILVTETNKLVLLKCHLYENEVVYFTMDLEVNKLNPFDKEAFFISLLPEFLLFINKPPYNIELFAVKAALYEQAIKYFSQYSDRNDLVIIKQGLMNRNAKYGEIEIERTRKKLITIKYGIQEMVVQFTEGTIEKNDTSFRTKTSPTLKEDIDAILIKAKEPKTNKAHFVFVSNIDKEVKRLTEEKKSKIPVSALFRQTGDGLELVKKPETRDSKLKYDYIYEVEL